MGLNVKAKSVKEYFGAEKFDELKNKTEDKAKKSVEELFNSHDNTSLKCSLGESDYFKNLVRSHFGK